MIKKILCSLIIGFGLLNFSSAYEVVDYSSVLSYVPEEFVYGNFTYNIDKNVNFNTYGYGNFIFWQGFNSYNSFNYVLGRIDNKLYFYSYNINDAVGYGGGLQGFFDTFCITDDINVRCSNFDISSDDFYNTISFNITKVLFGRIQGGQTSYEPYDPIGICFYNSNNELYYCAYSSRSITYSILTGSLGFSSLEEAQSYSWSSSPFSSSSNNVIVPIDTVEGYDYIELSTGDYVIMFEDKGYTKDLCYIGTTDLISKYEDGIPYYQGSGYTIFDFYNQLYGVSSFSIHEIGVFINTWFNNYKTFFLGYNRDMDGNPINSWFYNGPGVYGLNRSNIVNPFLNNLSAYYFLGSTIDYLDNNEYFDGEGLSTYCYKKGLISNVGSQYSIEDNHNSAIDSWALVSARNNRLIRNQFSGVNEINSQSWDGTILDNYSGVVYTDFNSFFSDSFNRFKGFFAGIDLSDLVLGQIPSYITMFLLAIILFRFLSK